MAKAPSILTQQFVLPAHLKAQIEYRLEEKSGEEAEPPENYCVWMQFSRDVLLKIDETARFTRNTSRESTLRAILCSFGEKHGIEVPQWLLPDPARPYKGRYPEFTIGIMVPSIKDSSSWVSRLLAKTSVSSFRNLVMRAVQEFDWSSLSD